MRLREKAALITGGGRGIGAATAILFAREGAKVGVMDLREESFREVVDRGRQMGLELKGFVGDVTDKKRVDQAVDAFVREFGRIDILVNNAGIAISRPFMEKTVEDWEKTLRVNLIGVFLCAQSAAKYMLQQKSGKIVNISSIRGIEHCGREGVMDYSASKTAVIGLTKTMAKQLAPYVQVNAVAPGHTKTEMTLSLPEEVKRNMIEGSFLKRMAEPEDIAKAILFMASEDADFITGQTLLVDGGFSLKRT
jgi:3-oxoacyl-[acyl-carrier protein] reductase